MTRVLILGATSGIAQAVARYYATQGSRLYLVGRNPSRTAELASALEVLRPVGASAVSGMVSRNSVEFEAADLSDVVGQGEVLDRAWRVFGGFDRVLIAYGELPDETALRIDGQLVQASLHVNLISVITLLDRLVAHAGRPSDLRIGVLGSVAGDRGRDRVSVYSVAKGGLERYCEALQQRTWPNGARIVLIKPGWVRTSMTAHMGHSMLIVSPERAARAIVSALDRGARTTYVPGWWWFIMLLVRNIPPSVFRRMKF